MKMKPDTAMMSYQHSTLHDEDTGVPLVTTITPSTTTTTTKMTTKMALLAGTMLMLVVAGGTVWMGDGGITPTAEGLVVAATEGSDPRACFNAGATFNGKSVYSSQNYPYDTCFQYDHWRQNPGKVHNCWTKSYQCGSRWCTCWPNGIYSKGHGPHMVNANTVTPMTWPLMSCGDPCPFQHQIAD